jgi:hypothetical protein
MPLTAYSGPEAAGSGRFHVLQGLPEQEKLAARERLRGDG